MDTASKRHPSDQSLRSFGLGKLDDASAVAIQEHIVICGDCRARVSELTSDTFLDRLRDAKPRPASMPPAWSSSHVGASRPNSEPSPAERPPAHTLPPGLADHPDYEILRELGRGGMGVVYLAENKLMGRKEVLKVVGGHLIDRPAVLERFLREIRAAARLHHTNIVTAYSALRIAESLVFAMEYVEGYDLSQLARSKGPLPLTHACNFIYQAALGLQYAHEKGMVHRDIKPSNLILAREGKKPVVKVLDFGLAKLSSEGQRDSGLTREGQMLGTPDYIAPEQIRNAQSADIRADIYSLGCTLYTLLAGRPPFQGEHVWDVFQAHISMNANPLNLLRPEIPVELAALVAKMMAKDPDRRFHTPTEVAQALTPFFKPATSQPSAFRPEDNRAKPSAGQPVAFREGEAPAQPPSNFAPPITSPPPQESPSQSEQKSSPKSPNGVDWESLIEIKAEETLTGTAKPKPPEPDPAPADSPANRAPWMWPAIASAIFGLVLLGVIVITIKGKDGEIQITAPDNKSFKVITPDVVVDHTATNENRTSTTAPDFRDSDTGLRVARNKSGDATFVQVVGSAASGNDEEVKLRKPNIEGVFVPLFNGRDKTGWIVERGDPAIWTVEGGAIVARSDSDWRKMSFLLTDRDYSDFIIRFQFQLPKNADSGFLFRALPGDEDTPIDLNIRSFDEVPSRMSALFWSRSGRPEDALLPNVPAELRPEGAWNDMEAEIRGDTLRASVNGREVLLAHLSELARRNNAKNGLERQSGRIGFQAHTGTVRFRRIEIQELPKTESIPTASGFRPLFNAKDLTGWIQPGNKNLFTIENGEIIGRTRGDLQQTEYLVTDKSYRDFHLKATVRLVSGNSGIQFRSLRAPNGSVSGPQFDVAEGLWGDLYEENGRGILEKFPPEKAAIIVRRDGWNEVEIIAQGDHVDTYLDGSLVTVRTDRQFRREGSIALQVHKGEPMEVRFKDLMIQTLGQSGSEAQTTTVNSTPVRRSPPTGGGITGFTPLFNGKDSTGWTPNPHAPLECVISDGAITTKSNGRLCSDRGDFSDFCFVAELKAEPEYLGSVFFRSGINSGVEDAYAIRINTLQPGEGDASSGSIIKYVHNRSETKVLYSAIPDLVRPNEWFTLRVNASGSYFEVWINNVRVSYGPDLVETFSSGHFALHHQRNSGPGQLACRRFDVKDLSTATKPSARADQVSAKTPGNDATNQAAKAEPIAGASEPHKAQVKDTKKARPKKPVAAGRIVDVEFVKVGNKITDPIYRLTISPDSQRLIHPIWSHCDMFDLKNGKELLTVGHRQIGAAAIGPKGTEFRHGAVGADGEVVVFSDDSVVRVLDKATGKMVTEFEPRPQEERVEWLWSAAPERIVGRGLHTIKLWNSQTGKLLQEWPARDVIAMDVSPKANHQVVTIHNNHLIKAWNVATGQELAAAFPDGTKRLNNIKISPDGIRLLCWDSGATDFYMIDPNTRDVLTFPGRDGKLRQVAAFGDAPLVVSGDSNGVIRVWDENEVVPIHEERCPSPVHQLLVSPDGKYVVVALDREIVFYSVNKIQAGSKTKGRR
jgi:serine/threonine protein kinase/WD40 repeat protein